MKKTLVFALILVLALGLTGCGNSSIIKENEAIFSHAVQAVTSDKVALNDLADFEWDTMYSFAPYLPKESIEEIIGFESDAIEVTVNEGMTQLLFVQGEKVVCCIYGYSSNLGYGVLFETQYNDEPFIAIRHDETALFTVSNFGEEIFLIYENNQRL